MTGIGSTTGADSNGNELEPESLSLVVKKEPKSDSKADSKAGITPALDGTLDQFHLEQDFSLKLGRIEIQRAALGLS